AEFATARGYVPHGDDLLGTYDGVPFSVDEALATVALVNDASEATLDVELGLDRRAVDSILAARPLQSVLALSELYYVGESALSKLKLAAFDGGEPTLTASARYAADLENALVDWYAAHGDDVAQSGGNSLAEAQAAVDVAKVEEVLDPEEDPYAYDPAV